MNKITKDDLYSEAETKRRLDTALRGARIAGPQHKSVTPKRPKAQRKSRKKS